ncbi:MAG: FTR1 family protein [Chloroflexota bacterium]
MLPSYLLALREGIEAALIIGVILGLLKKIDKKELFSIVWTGTALAVLVSILVGATLHLVGASFEGAAEEAFEGITMLLAAVLLTWMIWWMFHQAKNFNEKLKQDVASAAQSSKTALFTVAFLAVVREGVELAIFLTAASFTTTARDTLIGAGFGFLTVAILAWVLFSSLVKLNLASFFRVTGILLILFAAGLVAHGVHELNEIGWIPPVIEHLWDVNSIINEKSFTGEILKALFGYNGNPSLTEMIAYFGYLLLVGLSFRRQQLKTSQAVSEA